MKPLAPNERLLAPCNLDGGPQVDSVRFGAPQWMNPKTNQRNQSGELPVGTERLWHATYGHDGKAAK